MASEEIEISDLELIEELNPDLVFPIEGASKTFATTLKKLKDWFDVEGSILKQVPTGIILPYGGSTAPEGFLLCNGATINRTTYANLFNAIGTKYGTGDGSTTFRIPSASNIVTSVNTSVPIKGNGKTLGVTDGTTNAGLFFGLSSGIYNNKDLYGTNVGTSQPNANSIVNNKSMSITTDSSKSGIVGTVTRTSFTCNFIIKY